MTNLDKDFERGCALMIKLLRNDSHGFYCKQTQPYPHARAIVVDWLRNRGYTWQSIGDKFGRNHSALLLLRQRMLDNKKYSNFTFIRKLYNTFNDTMKIQDENDCENVS